MVKVMGACGSILVAVVTTAATVYGQAPVPAPPQQITAIGCVTRNGAVDVDKGVRRLNMDPNGLALTSARIVRSGNNRSSAVPGSQPDGSNSGTIPQQTIVGGRTAEPDTVAFALTGDQVKALGDQVGRRVEIVGRVTATNQAETDRPSGTTGRGENSAHPSAELPKLEVVSFRGATGPCQ